MNLTQDQYDKLLSLYVYKVIDDMDIKTLICFAAEQLEQSLRDSCSLPEELIEEIESMYDEDGLEELMEEALTV